MMKAYEDTKDISPIYKEFQAYYAGSFQSDLNALFHSYCERTETDLHFLGFNRDDLVHLDMIKVDMDKQLLVWPDKHHMAPATSPLRWMRKGAICRSSTPGLIPAFTARPSAAPIGTASCGPSAAARTENRFFMTLRKENGRYEESNSDPG